MANQAGIRTGPSTGFAVELDHFEFAIICALSREFDAVEASLDEIYDDQTPVQNANDPNFYKIGRIGPFNIVLACLPEMGKESAASAASSLQISFPSISLTLVVGICGGVPFPAPGIELILGDVVISHQVLKFDFGRQYPDRFEQRGGVQDTLDRSNRSIRSLIAGLQTKSSRVEFQEMHARYLQDVGEKGSIWKYPGMDQDRLFPSSFDLKDTPNLAGFIEENLVPRHRLTGGDNPKPRLLFGSIGSTDTVMKSAKHRDDLAQGSQLVGFEMEGSGVCNNLSCIIIKGVCDYADSHKTKVWQDYAAASAACATKSFLEILATKKFGSFVYCKALQIGSRTSSVTSQSVGEWQISPISSHSANVDQHIESVDEGLRRIADGIPNPLLRRTLISAASQAIHSSRTEIRRISKNRVFQSVPHTSVFGKIIFRTQVIERTISVGDESSAQSETQTSFTFHPAPWLLRLGIRYGLKAMAVNHHKTWQYSISPVNVRPDDSLIFRFCEMGNTEAVRELFERQQATVYDVNSKGMTLLHFAAFYEHLDLAKFLILQNADKQAYLYKPSMDGHFTPASFIRPYSSYETCLEWLYLFRDCIDFCEPRAAGWNILCGLEDTIGYPQAYNQLCQGIISFLLERLQEEVTVGVDWQAIEYAMWFAADRNDVDSMELILELDTQKAMHSRSLERERPILESHPNWLVLQFLAEKGIDIRTSLRGETPTSRCLEFSDTFFDWRDDARLLFPGIDRLVECETSEKPAPRLRGWCFDLLLDLFSVDIYKPLLYDYREDRIYLDVGAKIECLECDRNRKVSFFDGNDEGLIIEPWWLELKHSVKNRECLCSMNDVVIDGRDRSRIIPGSYRSEDIDSYSGSEANHSLGKSEYFSDTQPTQTQEMGSQANFDTKDDLLQDSASDPDISDTLARVVSPPDQRGIHRWGEVIPFQFWAEHCYKIYGGWINDYERLEYYCFKCLALREGWNAEYEEVCEYLEAYPEEAEANESDSDESD